MRDLSTDYSGGVHIWPATNAQSVISDGVQDLEIAVDSLAQGEWIMRYHFQH